MASTEDLPEQLNVQKGTDSARHSIELLQNSQNTTDKERHLVQSLPASYTTTDRERHSVAFSADDHDGIKNGRHSVQDNRHREINRGRHLVKFLAVDCDSTEKGRHSVEFVPDSHNNTTTRGRHSVEFSAVDCDSTEKGRHSVEFVPDIHNKKSTGGRHSVEFLAGDCDSTEKGRHSVEFVPDSHNNTTTRGRHSVEFSAGDCDSTEKGRHSVEFVPDSHNKKSTGGRHSVEFSAGDCDSTEKGRHSVEFVADSHNNKSARGRRSMEVLADDADKGRHAVDILPAARGKNERGRQSAESLLDTDDADDAIDKGRHSVDFLLDSNDDIYEEYLRCSTRQERSLKKRKTLPNLLPSDLRLSPTRTSTAPPLTPTRGPKSPPARRSSATERRSQSRATLFSASPDGPGSRATSASTPRATRKFLYSLAVISMSRRTSGDTPQSKLGRRDSGSSRLAGLAAAVRQSRPSLGAFGTMGSVTNMVTLRRRALLKLKLTKSQLMWKKLRVWVPIIYVLKKLLDKHASQAMTDPSSPFYSHKGEMDDPAAGIDKDHYMFFDPSHFKANRQMRMSQEAKRILTKPPEERTAEEIHFAMIGLRGLPIIAEYPVRMQRNLAQYGRFECFDAKRVIVKQGRRPEGFYFVLYGSVIVAVKDDITGFAKIVCDINRGESFGELAIMNKGTRNSSVLTKTYTELLSISDTAYEKIFMTGENRSLNDPDQYDFLSSMPFMRGWPVKKLFENPDPKNVTFGYFPRKSVLVKDSNFSDWLILVKSGSATVLKKLVRTNPTVSKRTGQYTDTSTTTGFFTFLSSDTDYNRWLNNRNITLPPPLTISDSDSDQSDDEEEEEEAVNVEEVEEGREEGVPEGGTGMEDCSVRNKEDDEDADMETDWPSTMHRARPLTSVGGTEQQTVKGIRKTRSAFRSGAKASVSFARKASILRRPKIQFGPDTNSELTDEVKFAATKRTFLDDLDAGFRARAHILTEADINPQFVYVHTLTKGDVFGLAPLVFPDQPSLCLISNGAECLMIKKKFYLDNCPQGLAQRLKVEVSPYPSEKKLQQDLVNRINWDVYKNAITRHVYEYSRVTVTPL